MRRIFETSGILNQLVACQKLKFLINKNQVESVTMASGGHQSVSYLAPAGLMQPAEYCSQTWLGEILLPLRRDNDVVDTISLKAKINTRYLNGEQEVIGNDWPEKLPIQLVGRYRLEIFSQYIEDDSRKVKIRFQPPCKDLSLLHDALRANYAPCVHIRPADPQKPRMVMYILYSTHGFWEFVGFLPNNPNEVLKIMIDLNPAFDSKPLMPYYSDWKNENALD